MKQELYEFLTSYKTLCIDFERLNHAYDILNLKVINKNGAIQYSIQPRGSNISHKTEDAAIEIAEAWKKCEKKIDEIKHQLVLIEMVINRVPDERGRYVLWEKYVRFRRLDDIGEDELIDRCGRQARRYHDEAIEWLEEREGLWKK